MSTAILCELKKLLHNAAFCLFGALLLAAGAIYPFVRALAPDANGVALMDRQAVLAAYEDVSPQQAAADIEDRLDALEVYGQLQLLAQPDADGLKALPDKSDNDSPAEEDNVEDAKLVGK